MSTTASCLKSHQSKRALKSQALSHRQNPEGSKEVTLRVGRSIPTSFRRKKILHPSISSCSSKFEKSEAKSAKYTPVHRRSIVLESHARVFTLHSADHPKRAKGSAQALENNNQRMGTQLDLRDPNARSFFHLKRVRMYRWCYTFRLGHERMKPVYFHGSFSDHGFDQKNYVHKYYSLPKKCLDNASKTRLKDTTAARTCGLHRRL